MAAISLTLAQVQVSGGGGGGGGGGGRGGPIGQAPSLRYGGQYEFRSQSRLLPSEARGVQSAAGLLPSQRRDLRYQSGALPSQGGAPYVAANPSMRYSGYAQARQQVAGGYQMPATLRYQNPQVQPIRGYPHIPESSYTIQYRTPNQQMNPQRFNATVRYGQPVRYGR